MFAKWHGWSGRFLLSIMVILIAVLVQPAQSTQANASLAVDPFDVLQTVAQKGVGTASSFVTGSSILGGERDVVSTVTAGTARLRVLVNFGGSRRLSHNQQTGVAAKTEVQWDGVDGSATVNPVGLGSLNLAAANAFVVESAKLDFGAISLKMTVYSGASSCSSLTKNLVAGLARDMSFPFAAFQPACSSPANFASVGAITLLIDGTLQQDSDASIGPVKLVGGSIGNYVWLDENNDGYQDAGEPGIPNVVVELLDDQGNVVATTVTDAHGGYLFTGLVPGTYTVRVDQTTLPKDQDGNVAMTQTTHPVNGGADFGNQDDANGYTVTIGAGEENLTADFGFNWNTDDEVNNNNGNAALGDRVWVDVNGNGAQEPEEIGVEGVLVNLITAGPDGLFGTGDDVVFDTDITDANGNYIFDNLPPGAYVVEIDVSNFASGGALEGYTQTGDPDHFGTTGTNNDDQTTTPVVLAPGDVFLNADFGYQPPDAQNNSIGDKVWFDADADGVGPNGNGAAPGDDNSETGIPGVTVALIRDANGNGVWDAGESIIATTTTDANGDYLFSGLPDGSYLVWVNDTDNVLGDKVPTYDSDDGTAPTGSGAPTGVTANSVLGLSSVLNLGVSTAAPDSNLVQDFGYTAFGQTDTTGLIGDRVWLDIDGDGVQDANEPGLEGIRVELRDGSNNLIGVTFTDENGNYYFGGLPAGTYTVVVATPPAGMTQTFDADGIGTAHQSTVTIGAGEINLLQDFGYRGPGSIGDFVWEDLNANGVVDAGENGIAGVTLDLYHDLNGNGQVDAGEPLVGSTITDANGQYSFTGLFVDDGGGDAAYVVDVTDEAGVLAGWWHSLGAPGTNNNSQTDPYAVTLTTAKTSDDTADFGYYVKPAALGNRVWDDTNADGIQDSGEPNLAGVKVQLAITYPNDTVTTLTTLTDANGFYSFGNLLLDEDYNGVGTFATPGVGGGDEPAHVISAVTPAGYVPTAVDIGSNDRIDSDEHTGVPAFPRQGLTDVAAQVDPNAEPDVASYDFGYKVVCDLVVDKTCQLPPPPPTEDLACTAKIAATLLRYTGPDLANATVVFEGKAGGSATYSNVNLTNGTVLSQNGWTVDGRPGDLGAKLTIRVTDNDAGTTTEEVIHTSCSTPYVAGQPAPLDNPKGDPSPNWFVESFVDKNGNEVSVPEPTPAESCEATLGPTPSCKTEGKPSVLTFKYTGADCSASSNTQDPSKATCTDNSALTDPAFILITDRSNPSDGGAKVFFSGNVNVGQTFDVKAANAGDSELRSETFYHIFDGSGGALLQDGKFHTSCSQPLEVGDVFGSLELVAFNGQEAGVEVTYFYDVTNNGTALTNVTLVDVPLGNIAGPFDLASGETRTFSTTATITETITNTGIFSGTLANSAVCQASDQATVTVTEPCDVCKGGVTDLTLRYLGTSPASIVVYNDPGAKPDKILFGPQTVAAGAEFSFSKPAGDDKFNTDISVWVNGALNTKIHTSCSQPIGPGVIFGDFEVVEGRSKDNGRICPLNTCDPDAAGQIEFHDKEVRWDVTNNGDLGLEIERITISWPSANGYLDEIKRDGDVIHKGNFSSSPATIDSGWEGDANKRTIKPGETDTLKFKFQNDASMQDEYDITVDFDQGCSISFHYEPGATPGPFTCSKPIDALTMIWDGGVNDVWVTAWKGSVGSTALATLAPVSKGGELTVSGYAGSPNDVIWQIFTDAAGTSLFGESTFHLSCSDSDMNGPEDCGKREGDGKGQSGFLNDWLLEGIVDSNETLDCTP